MKESSLNSDIIAAVIQSLLRPLIRFCLRHSVKIQQFQEIAKATFVEVASELDKEALSVSRLAVMTGVHRKDVVRLTDQGMKSNAANDIFTRVVGCWRSHPKYSRRGEPKLLRIAGGAGEFHELVRSVTKEINPYTVLLELERQGLVIRDEDSLKLLTREFVPKRDPEAGFRLVAEDLKTLLEAAEENIFKDPAIPNLHLTTRYDNICQEDLLTIRRWLMAEGAKLHKRARLYLSKYDKDLNPKLANRRGGCRIALGSFSFVKEPGLSSKKIRVEEKAKPKRDK